MGGALSHDDDGAPPPPMPPSARGIPQRSAGLRPSYPPNPFPLGNAPQSPISPLANHAAQENNQAPVQHSGIVANVLNVNKNSVKLTPIPGNPHVYLLEFVFDAHVEGFITIYYCARQIIHRAGQKSLPTSPVVKLSYADKGDRLPGKTPFSKGDKQRYRQNVDKGLDVRNFTSAELQNVDVNHFPVVIRLEAVYPDDTTVPKEEQVICQTTFATLVPQNGMYKLEVVGQQVLVNGTIYKILDLYGIGGKDITASKNKDNNYVVDPTDECVICLTEPCNMAVEPCNHLCLCEDCARALWTEPDRNRRKCPVCRSELVKLLQIIPAPRNSSPPSPDNEDEAESNSALEAPSALPAQSASASSAAQAATESKMIPADANSQPAIPPPMFQSLQQNQQSSSQTSQMYIQNDLSTLTLDPSSRNAP